MEIPSAHCYHQQVTIHPIVAYYNCLQCQETVQESVLFISDDLTHDALAVHKFVSMTNTHLKDKRMIDIQHEVQYSDGCSSQYKSFTPFCDISYALQDYGFAIERLYYSARHGKGPCDGAGAVLKSSARRTVMGQEQVINNSKDLYEFAKSKLVKDDKPYSDEHLHSKCTVFHVSESEISRNRPDRVAKTLKGTRILHSIKTKESMNIFVCHQSCFCQSCQTGIGQCENAEYVDNWKEVHLFRQGEDRPRVRRIGNIGAPRGRRGQNAGERDRRGQVKNRGRPRDLQGGQRGIRGQVRTRGGQSRTRGGQGRTRGQVRTRGGQGRTRGQRGRKRGAGRDGFSSDSSEVSEPLHLSYNSSEVSEPSEFSFDSAKVSEHFK